MSTHGMVDKESSEAGAFSSVMERVANIITNVSDRQSAGKVLQFYPEHDMLGFIGKSSTLDVTGCIGRKVSSSRSSSSNNSSDDSSSDEGSEAQNGNNEPTSSSVNVHKEKYREIINCDLLQETELPFKWASFSLVVNCIPPDYFDTTGSNNNSNNGSGSGTSVYSTMLTAPYDVLKLVSDAGYAVIGMKHTLWEQHNVLDALMSGSSTGAATKNTPRKKFGTGSLPLNWSLMSVQKLELDGGVTYFIAVIRKVK